MSLPLLSVHPRCLKCLLLLGYSLEIYTLIPYSLLLLSVLLTIVQTINISVFSFSCLISFSTSSRRCLLLLTERGTLSTLGENGLMSVLQVLNMLTEETNYYTLPL